MATGPEWRGQADTTRRALWALLGLSLVLHLPLTPLGSVFGLVAALKIPDDRGYVDLNADSAIPIDFISEGGEPSPADGTESPPGGEPTAVDPEDPEPETEPEPVVRKRTRKRSKKKSPVGADAGVADGGADAGAPLDAGVDAAPEAGPKKVQPDAGPTKAPAGAGGVGDPVAMSGRAGRITDSNANVRLLVFNDRLRRHPTGPLIGKLLGSAAQWKDFFVTSRLDPIKDLDRILIAAPQLRDSSGAVIVARYRGSQGKVKKGIDRLIARSKGGKWIAGPMPVARARADRADRSFILPRPSILVIGPPGIEDQVRPVRFTLSFPKPKGKEVLTTYLKSPYRAFKGIPFDMPDTIKWVRMSLLPYGSGGVRAVLRAEDSSPKNARDNARKLERNLTAITRIKLPGFVGALFGKKEKVLVERVHFTARGKYIHGEVDVTGRQLGLLLEEVAELAKVYAQKSKKKAAKKSKKKAAKKSKKNAAKKKALEREKAAAKDGKKTGPGSAPSSTRAPAPAPSAAP